MKEIGEHFIPAHVFLFFAAGLAVNHFWPEFADRLNVQIYLPLYVMFPVICVFLFSLSVFGIFMIPVCIMLSGYVTGYLSAEVLHDSVAYGGPAVRLIVMEAAVVPAFFLLSVRGMRIAERMIRLCRRERGIGLPESLGLMLILTVFIFLTVYLAVIRW